MRKKNLPLIPDLKITDAGAEGMAVGRHNDMVVFVPWAVPGDIADVQVTRRRKKYMDARILSLTQPSELRAEPYCPHFGLCGGCRWQNMQYSAQLHYKEKWVYETLQRLGRFPMPPPLPIMGSDETRYYRNKLEYTFSDRRYLHAGENREDPETEVRGLGFHLPGRFDRILDIEECWHQPHPSNDIRLSVRAFALQKGYTFQDLRSHSGLLRNLILRNNLDGDFMVIVVFSEYDKHAIRDLLEHIRTTFPAVRSLYYTINPKPNDSIHDLALVHYSGEEVLYEQMDGLRFRIGPVSFFQTNARQAQRLYRLVKEFAGLTGKEHVYDLYTGTGTIACYLAGNCQQVTGIEYVEDAVRDARINANLNGITNTRFFAGDMAKVLSPLFLQMYGAPDVIVTDPPRAGMHPEVVAQILAAGPARIVYVSCNPATQARDVALLSEAYQVEIVQPVDMFPHTSHVENIMLLVKKG